MFGQKKLFHLLSMREENFVLREHMQIDRKQALFLHILSVLIDTQDPTQKAAEFMLKSYLFLGNTQKRGLKSDALIYFFKNPENKVPDKRSSIVF